MLFISVEYLKFMCVFFKAKRKEIRWETALYPTSHHPLTSGRIYKSSSLCLQRNRSLIRRVLIKGIYTK